MDIASAWIARWCHLITPGGTVLDVACGSGRHLGFLSSRGLRPTGVDRDAAALARCAGLGELIQADLEADAWPLAGRQFDAVVVTNYLWRPLLPAIVAALAPGGVLLYETFAVGNEAFGRPSNPDFLLRHGELLAVAQGLRVVAFEDGFADEPPRQIQRIAAARETGANGPSGRYALWA